MAQKANQPIRWKERIGTLVLGLTANIIIVKAYDYVVYPYLLIRYGLVTGWVLAVVGSIVLCLGTLWFYDVTKQDWLGIETAKLVRDEKTGGRIRRFFWHISNSGDVPLFFFLSLKYDPFITLVAMRRGSGNYKMSARDWKIFWASIVVSNAWWGAIVFGAVEVFKRWLAPWFGF